MAWIRSVGEDEATAPVKAVYEASKRLYGFVPNIRKAISLDPAALEAYAQLSQAAYHGTVLAPEDRELIATVVSVLNRCHY